MTGRSSATPGGANCPTGSPDNNQPMDLAQKSQSARITDVVTNAVKGGTTFVFGSTQLIASNAPPHVVTSKAGIRNEGNMSGTGGVTLFSRQASHGALNLVSPNSGSSLSTFASNVTVGSRSGTLQTPTSVTIATSPSMPASAYHIPRGAAAAANMTASRSPNLASIVRTTSQIVGSSNTTTLNSPRANIISQRMVPISNSNWISRSASTAAVLSTKASTSQVIGRTPVPSGRSSTSSTTPVTTYHSGSVKSGSVVTNTIRSQGPSTVRVGATNEAQKPSKGIHTSISHPASHAQKYIGTSGTATVRGVGTGTFISPGNIVGTSISTNTVYTPSSTLVTSLASSGTTITPHPGNRNQPPNTVRLTSAVTTVFTQASSQVNSTSLGGICLTAASNGTILNHHPRTQQPVDQISVKTPIVRATHPPSSQPHIIKGTTPGLPAGTHISFSGPKVIAQPSQGPTLAFAQLSNVSTHKPPGTVLTSQAGINSAPFQSRTGAIVAPSVGRGGPTISMTKVIPQVKGVVNQGLATSLPTVSTAPSSVTSGANTDQQPAHTSVFVHRTHSVTMSTGVIPVSQPERTASGVTQYSIGTPYYIDSNQTSFPVNASLVPTNHYIPSSVSTGTLRVGGNGAISTIVTTSSEVNNIQGMAMPIIKPNSSPRPSILRKRPEIESSAPLKAAKNLSAALNIPMASPPSPIRPDSRGNGNVSSGSTTASANSSPGMLLNEEDSTIHNVKMPCNVKPESVPNDGCTSSSCMISFPSASRPQNGKTSNENVNNNCNATDRSSLCGQNSSVPFSLAVSQSVDGVSPRKKPRKQQLMGNELHEARSSEDDFEQNVMKRLKKEPPCVKQILPPVESSEEEEKDYEKGGPKGSQQSDGWGETSPSPEPIIRRPHMSLMNSYRQTWKARHNHFYRHSDVRPKEEKKRTVNEIANQKLAMQRVNGWKVMHLSGQVEDLVEMESEVVSRLQVILSAIEKRQQQKKPYREFDKDVNRLSELVKANIQRSVIIKDQMSDAKVQMSKIFNHKENIVNILTKYGNNKRTLRKKEKT